VKRIVVFTLSALPLFTLLGQEAKKVQEPEYIGVVFYLDPAGALAPLERQQSNQAAKMKAFGFGGVQGSTSYKGAKSPVRFNVGQVIQFIVRVNAPGIEPDSLVNMDVLKVSKKDRAIVTLKSSGPMGLGGIKTRTGETLRTLNFTKYGENSLMFSSAQALDPGEYVITAKGGANAFLFGIDPK
jgi:hypothetical protein